MSVSQNLFETAIQQKKGVNMRVTADSKLIMTRSEWLDIGKKAGWTDNIPGGLADGETVCSIAESHDVSVDLIEEQLKMGVKVEMEHTDDPKIAREIAMDHLVEDPNYYTKLDKMENE